MEIFDVVICLVRMHVHGETFRPDFPNPKSNDVAVVEDDELSPGSWILNCTDSLPHSRALNWDLVGGQEAQSQITTKNSLHFIIVIVVVERRQTMT